MFITGGGTGGHLYPGLAIARALGRVAPQVRIVFVGARRGIERTVLPQQSFPFELLDLHPFYRTHVWRNWRTLWGAARGWGDVGRLVARERPALVLGTGGYASALTLAYAVSHRIPIVQQIADSHPGLTARRFVRYSREAYLGYPEAAAQLRHSDRGALIDTGNPIDPPPTPRPDPGAARRAWQFPSDVTTVLLVFGGSQGAKAINVAVDSWMQLPLPPHLGVIWATGPSAFGEFAQRDSAQVKVRPYLSPIGDAYAAADLALTRAGAMTTAELCAWGIPMILVPLPSAAADHQTANAQALVAAGAAVHLPQELMTSDAVSGIVTKLSTDPTRRATLAAAARARGRPGASEDIARRILRLLELR